MKRIGLLCGFLLLVIFSLNVSGAQKAKNPQYAPVTVYDPARDADKDIRDAVAEATRTGKRVLLEVGGQWCVWCRILDRYFEEHKELTEFKEKNFIMVKINYSEENENKTVLSRYPEIRGYPHLFVLDSGGKLLHSQDTAELEKGKSYDLEKFFAFLKKWSPQSDRPTSNRER
ncbi:MAG: thioredoxin family protein [Blastocatellia bacterium]|nr:thioredoxin family protein [Blastocatellia bacterium]